MAQVCVRLDDEVVAQIDAQAHRAGLRRSEVIRRAILRGMVEAAPDVGTLGERFGHLFGVVDSEVPDLGSRHHDYLVERFRDGR